MTTIQIIPKICLVILLVCSNFSQSQVVPGHISWSDNFEDQDLETWIVTRGVFSAEQKTLWAYGTEAWASNRAYHDCNVTTGRWSFDIYFDTDWIWRCHPPSIRFMVNSTDDVIWQGYSLEFYKLIHKSGTILSLYLRVHRETWTYLANFDFDCAAKGWQSIDIIRNPQGRITVFLNASLVIDVTDSSIETSNYFVFDSEDCVQTAYNPDTHTDSFIKAEQSPMLDNILVYEISDSSYSVVSSFVLVISVIGTSVALVIIGKEEREKRSDIIQPDMLQ